MLSQVNSAQAIRSDYHGIKVGQSRGTGKQSSAPVRSSPVSLFSILFQTRSPSGNNSIEGKFSISKTDERTVTLTRVHDQGQSHLCWDYSATSSLRQSLRVKIGEGVDFFLN